MSAVLRENRAFWQVELAETLVERHQFKIRGFRESGEVGVVLHVMGEPLSLGVATPEALDICRFLDERNQRVRHHDVVQPPRFGLPHRIRGKSPWVVRQAKESPLGVSAEASCAGQRRKPGLRSQMMSVRIH